MSSEGSEQSLQSIHTHSSAGGGSGPGTQYYSGMQKQWQQQQLQHHQQSHQPSQSQQVASMHQMGQVRHQQDYVYANPHQSQPSQSQNSHHHNAHHHHQNQHHHQAQQGHTAIGAQLPSNQQQSTNPMDVLSNSSHLPPSNFSRGMPSNNVAHKPNINTINSNKNQQQGQLYRNRYYDSAQDQFMYTGQQRATQPPPPPPPPQQPQQQQQQTQQLNNRFRRSSVPSENQYQNNDTYKQQQQQLPFLQQAPQIQMQQHMQQKQQQMQMLHNSNHNNSSNSQINNQNNDQLLSSGFNSQGQRGQRGGHRKLSGQTRKHNQKRSKRRRKYSSASAGAAALAAAAAAATGGVLVGPEQDLSVDGIAQPNPIVPGLNSRSRRIKKRGDRNMSMSSVLPSIGGIPIPTVTSIVTGSAAIAVVATGVPIPGEGAVVTGQNTKMRYDVGKDLELFSHAQIIQQYKRFKRLKLKMNKVTLASGKRLTNSEYFEEKVNLFQKMKSKTLNQSASHGEGEGSQQGQVMGSTAGKQNISMLDQMIEKDQKRKQKYDRQVSRLLEEYDCQDEDSFKMLISKLYRQLRKKTEHCKNLSKQLKERDGVIEKYKSEKGQQQQQQLQQQQQQLEEGAVGGGGQEEKDHQNQEVLEQQQSKKSEHMQGEEEEDFDLELEEDDDEDEDDDDGDEDDDDDDDDHDEEEDEDDEEEMEDYLEDDDDDEDDDEDVEDFEDDEADEDQQDQDVNQQQQQQEPNSLSGGDKNSEANANSGDPSQQSMDIKSLAEVGGFAVDGIAAGNNSGGGGGDNSAVLDSMRLSREASLTHKKKKGHFAPLENMIKKCQQRKSRQEVSSDNEGGEAEGEQKAQEEFTEDAMQQEGGQEQYSEQQQQLQQSTLEDIYNGGGEEDQQVGSMGQLDVEIDQQIGQGFDNQVGQDFGAFGGNVEDEQEKEMHLE